MIPHHRFICLKSFPVRPNLPGAQKTTGLLRRHIKVLLALACALAVYSGMACAEDWTGFQLAENERIMAYHNSGEILCSVLDAQRQLTAVKKLDDGGQMLWTYDFNDSFIRGTLLFRAQEDGSAYAFCGKKQASDKYEVILINEDGQWRQTMTPSPDYTPRALTDTGVLFLSPYDESENRQQMEHVGWDGKYCSAMFEGKLIEVQQTCPCGENVFFSIVYDQPHTQRQAAILILNLETGHLSRYDVGSNIDFFVQAMGESTDGSVVAVVYDQAQVCQRVIQLTSSGKPMWQTELYTNLYGPVAQIVKPNNQGGYFIWGTVAIPEDGGSYPQNDATYCIELGENGELMDEALGIYSGTCVVYKTGRVYVADVDAFSYVSLDTFKEDTRVRKPIFYTRIGE